MFCGMVFGYCFRKRHLAFVQKLITALIWLLLFSLGLEVGANRELVAALPSLGIEALVITLAALGGCMAGSWLLWRRVAGIAPGSRQDEAGEQAPGDGHPLKGSLVIVSFFAAGCLAGYFSLFSLSESGGRMSFLALCLLMFCVGFSLGNDPDTIRRFRKLDPRLMLLPLVTVFGTWAGCALISLVLKERSLVDCLAVGSGFGYYSLSSIFISESKGAALGTIALLSNIFRELATLLLAPWLAKAFGKLAPISAGGATTMDTTFPVIVRTCGREYAIVSIFHGFIMDFSVPFLVSFFCSL